MATMKEDDRQADWQKRAEDAEEVLRGLASYLGVGGFNAETVDADVFDRKIRDGIEILTAPLRQGWQRYLKLRSIGAAPNGTLHLQKGLVMVATNLDAWVDEYLEKGRPPAPSHAVEFTAARLPQPHGSEGRR